MRKHLFKNVLKKIWRSILRSSTKLIIIGLALCLFIAGAAFIWVASLPIPDFSGFEDRLITQSTKIYDRTGEILLFDAHKDIRRTVVSGNDISRNIKNAAVAIEDSGFYQHSGIEPLSIARAMLANFQTGRFSQGGSTITQQVIKNSLLTQEKRFSRKIKEIILAIKMERTLTKDEILTIYLNESPYGGNLYGIEEASRAFFGKSAISLTLAESAYLAALPNAPTYFSPYGNNRDALEDRKNLVLSRMQELGFITPDDRAAALSEEVSFAPLDNRSIKAPHFVMYVKGQLEQRYGKDIVENGGLKVITTLDWGIQQQAEATAREFAPEIEEKFNAKNVGIVATDPKSGHVLAMVGSRDYFDQEHEGNFNVTLAHRQPGSTFKPFVYATAFMKGYTPDTVVFDLATEFNANCPPASLPPSSSTCYRPQNYDGLYRGPMKLRDALAQSVNIPAVKMLYLAGVRDSISTARAMGITGLENPDRYGLTLVLGGGEVSPLDLTIAYGVFANDGVRNSETTVIKVEDRFGAIIEEWQATPTRAITAESARQISDILTDNDARAPAFGSNSDLYIEGRDVAVKTGTTNNYRDMWIVGYTPDIALTVWAGNNDNTPMEKKVAGFVVAPIWRSTLNRILPLLPQRTFLEPDPIPEDIHPILRGVWQGGEEYVINKATGTLANELTPFELREKRVVPSIHSILHWINKNDPLGPGPRLPNTDSQYFSWETSVRSWASAQGYVDGSPTVIPKEDASANGGDNHPTINVSSPSVNTSYRASERIIISISIQGQYPIQQATYHWNNIYLGASRQAPFSFSFVPEHIGPSSNQNILKIQATDQVGNRSELLLPLTIIP
ncbi:MAG: penicillin-binding protein [Candidatus Vogelbacteria bacterium CG10_big_fil_rev_8_21_14_0_10_51_16]|uniref:Penicillin-binding protein n=1 Tax=Candidatus Vogelbacteria bacterium CG10_big_fil_rev_8_21_14_0_10_51_16 TaxID=1975045 RepID=A0A2H0RF21_9BACT|nr:MAG: penicillin-binding protein [Candidatus Vogelbacteria bacterium CG10_big_fil_rev_8_21_14_0_10_51_16]